MENNDGFTLRMIIAGNSDFEDYRKVFYTCMGLIMSMSSEINDQFKEIEIISGGSPGADKLGEKFANSRGYKLKVINALWEREEKFAGYQRNERMARYAIGDYHIAGAAMPREKVKAVLVAFWDGRSRGTKNMISFAHMYEFDSIHVEFHPVKEEIKYERPKINGVD